MRSEDQSGLRGYGITRTTGMLAYPLEPTPVTGAVCHLYETFQVKTMAWPVF
jgi:hypothetical protein